MLHVNRDCQSDGAIEDHTFAFYCPLSYQIANKQASIPSATSPLTCSMGEEHTVMTFTGPVFQSSDCKWKPQGKFL